MKTKLHFLIALISLLFTTNISIAQTTLAVGDIVVLLNQTDTPDDFAFVTFVDLAAGTVIYFTDCGADASGFNTPCAEGARAYTVPAGGHLQGAIIKFAADTNTDFASYTDTRITGAFAMSTGGDQVVVFQDASNPGGSSDAANNPQYIFVSSTASTLFTGNKTDSNETGLPNGLDDTTPPRSALGLGAGTGVDNEYDNAVYMGSYDFSGSSVAAAKLALTDPTNYHQQNDITTGSYPGYVAAIPASLMLPTLSTEESTLANALAIYPNPSQGMITIKNSGIALESAQIIDVNGRTVGSFNLNGITSDKIIDISTISSGMYFMNIYSKNASVTKKLIIK